jgi:hypothetical protein
MRGFLVVAVGCLLLISASAYSQNRIQFERLRGNWSVGGGGGGVEFSFARGFAFAKVPAGRFPWWEGIVLLSNSKKNGANVEVRENKGAHCFYDVSFLADGRKTAWKLISQKPGPCPAFFELERMTA